MSILRLQVNYGTHKTKYYRKSCIPLYVCEFFINIAHLTVHSVRFFFLLFYVSRFILISFSCVWGACTPLVSECRSLLRPQLSDPQDLQTQAFLSFSTWVLGIQLWSSARFVNAPDCWAISSAFIFNLKVFPQKCISQSPLGFIWTIELQLWLTENTICNIKCFLFVCFQFTFLNNSQEVDGGLVHLQVWSELGSGTLVKCALGFTTLNSSVLSRKGFYVVSQCLSFPEASFWIHFQGWSLDPACLTALPGSNIF